MNDADLRVEGTLTPPGCFGHLGAYHRELKVTKVISVESIYVRITPTPGFGD